MLSYSMNEENSCTFYNVVLCIKDWINCTEVNNYSVLLLIVFILMDVDTGTLEDSMFLFLCLFTSA